MSPESKKNETPEVQEASLEKEHKHFKAVTEEVLPEIEESSKTEAKKSFFVKETNNIISDPKLKEDGGIFFKFFLVTFFATLLALLLVGGIYVYITGIKNLPSVNVPKQTPLAIPSQTAIPTATPVASPSATLSTYKVSVLNGNGGIGVATAAKNIIEKAGFKVSYIGNADNFNFTDTLVQAKASVPQNVVDIVNASLTGSYSIKAGNQLDPADAYDIIVTVGSK